MTEPTNVDAKCLCPGCSKAHEDENDHCDECHKRINRPSRAVRRSSPDLTKQFDHKHEPDWSSIELDGAKASVLCQHCDLAAELVGELRWNPEESQQVDKIGDIDG
jgi:hypothetical protein